MEHIKEVVTGLFQSPEIIALLSAAGAWLSANLVTIIVFACKYLKLKSKEIKEKMLHEQTIEALNKEYEVKMNQLAESIDSKLNKLESHVVSKIDLNNEEEAKAIEAETVQLKKAIKETKKTLSIDEILENE